MPSPSADACIPDRDPVVDANPDLRRTRPRLSEEADDAVLIEVLPPDDRGATFESAIELDDEDDEDDDGGGGGGDDDMPTYCHTFGLSQDIAHLPPSQQLDELLLLLNGGICLEPWVIENLSFWIEAHLHNTRNDLPDSWCAGYTHHNGFFARLGIVLYQMLLKDELCEEKALRRLPRNVTARMIKQFHQTLTELSIRMMTVLSLTLDTSFSRRDSGRVAKSRQRIDFAEYLWILQQVLLTQFTPVSVWFRELSGFRPDRFAKIEGRSLMSAAHAPRCFIVLFQKLAEHHAQVEASWEMMDVTLRLLNEYDTRDVQHSEGLLAICHELVLPVIGRKHPRAVPEHFHALCIQSGTKSIEHVVQDVDSDIPALLFDRFIRSEHDALLPESMDGTSATSLLRTAANGNPRIMRELLSTAWVLQALKSFIYSEIMDLRSIGISLFSKRLLEIHTAHLRSKEGVEHPVMQYVARFMRTNELTKYIFGPNSHAGLLTHSQNIVSFLGATLAYTNLETDIIWHACTNSVEADFVKASFGILNDLFPYLDLDQLVYLAQKYASTSPTKLGQDAVDSLSVVFHRLHTKDIERDPRRLTTANISIDILMSAERCESNAAILQLRDVARNELLLFTNSFFSPEDRLHIYQRCVPALSQPGVGATTSIEIFLLFLRSQSASLESEKVLSMLPVGTLVDEFGRHVESLRKIPVTPDDGIMRTIEMRLEAIIRLMGLPHATFNEESLHLLYRCAAGDLALNNEARDLAWLSFQTFSLTANPVSTISNDLLERFLRGEVLKLPLDFITPRLIHLLGQAQARYFTSDERDFEVLESPVWHKIVHIAEAAQSSAITKFATTTICDLLFDLPSTLKVKGPALRRQKDFTQRQVSRICELFKATNTQANGADHPVTQSLHLLQAVLRKCRESSHIYKQVEPLELVLDDNGVGAEASLYCALQIHAGHSQPRTVHLRASYATKLSELAARLPDVTGAAKNRIVLRGKILKLDDAADQELTAVGIQPGSVVPVSPKHTSDSNLSATMLPPSPVEEVILEKYRDLETLLDGPTAIAEKMFEILAMVSPPTEARSRIISYGSVTAAELFPPNKLWRSAFSLFLLKTHLHDFARLGVADHAFLANGVALLVETLSDTEHAVRPDFCVMALDCLLAFLHGTTSRDDTAVPVAGQEAQREAQPAREPSTSDLIPNPGLFVSRIIEICFFAAQQHLDGRVATRCNLVTGAVRTLLQAFRRQTTVWRSFAEHDRVVELHSLTLLHPEPALSAMMAATIKNFCQDTTSHEDVADFYTKVMLSILPQALKHNDHATRFFDLATQVILANTKLGGDEARAREISRDLVATLWKYRHTESVDLPVADGIMIGILKLLTAAVKILRSFKKPLLFADLSATLFERLLFPPMKDPASRPLVNHESRRLAYGLVQNTCDSTEDFSTLLARVSSPLECAIEDPHARYPGDSIWLRSPDRHAGLTNLGMTCYMNSLLQQLFANVAFRKFVLNTAIVRPSNQAVLFEVQILFARMQDDAIPVADTTSLARVLNIQTDSQEDVHGFYADFLSRLEASMPDDQSKLALSRFYSGKLISQIKGECGHVSPKTEPFVDLPIIVKNKASLKDSLDEFVQGEPMEGANQYKCMSCDPENGGRLVNAMKRACPEELPDNLTFCLKRFTWEAILGFDGKVNDRFEFPQSIDMSTYHRAYLEGPNAGVGKDVFELVGVIVHQGTLNLGHYWSYVLMRNTTQPKSRNWVKLEDKNVSACPDGIEGVQRECFGGTRYTNGHERADNAYVLFYARKTSIEEEVEPAPGVVSSNLLPARVRLPPMLRDTVHEGNAWRFHIAHLFGDDFAVFMAWMLQAYRDRAPAPALKAEHESTSSSGTDDASSDSETKESMMQQLSMMAALYIQRVAVCEPVAGKRLKPFLKGLWNLFAEESSMVFELLQLLLQQPEWFKRLTTHDTRVVRSEILNFMRICLGSLHEHDMGAYQVAFRKVLQIHSSMLNTQSLLLTDWSEYLSFAEILARVGPHETATVLDAGYLRWVLEVMCVPADPMAKKRNTAALEQITHNPDKVKALFQFVAALLDGYVDISGLEKGISSTGPLHNVTPDGVMLLPEENLLFTNLSQGIPSWMHAARWAAVGDKWQDHAPGRLLVLMMRKSPVLAQHMPGWLTTLIQIEEISLNGLLFLVLAFCASCDDAETASPVVQAMSRTIGLWDVVTDVWVHFLSQAYATVPRAVLESASAWISELLKSKHAVQRKQVEAWLREVAFGAAPITDTPAIDAARARLARSTVAQLWPVIQTAYDHESPRRPHEQSVQVLGAAQGYLKRLREQVDAATNGDGDESGRAAVEREHRIESDEAKVVLRQLRPFDQMAENWEDDDAEAALPGTSGLDRSAEVASSEEPETSDEEDWEE